MRVFITGVGGGLGRALAHRFLASGWLVRGASHAPERLGALAALLESFHALNLDGPLNSSPFRGCNAVIHCAYDATPGALERNVTGTTALCAAVRKAEVPYQLFVSSHSARPDALSEYGQIKHHLETVFLEQGQGVIRPGLIIGPNGLYARIAACIARSPLLVLPGADQAPVYFIALNDLLLSMEQMVSDAFIGAVNMFVDPPATLRQFCLAVASATGRRPPVLALPLTPLMYISRRFRSLPRPLARLATLRQNLEQPIHRSDASRFLGHPTSLGEAIASLAGMEKPGTLR